MDWVITSFRLPLAFIAISCITGFWSFLFVCETAAVLVMLPIAVVALSRVELKASFVARYPNSAPMSNIGTATNRLYSWAFVDTDVGSNELGVDAQRPTRIRTFMRWLIATTLVGSVLLLVTGVVASMLVGTSFIGFVLALLGVAASR